MPRVPLAALFLVVAGAGLAWCGVVVHWEHYVWAGSAVMLAGLTIGAGRQPFSSIGAAVGFGIACVPTLDTVRQSLAGLDWNAAPDILLALAMLASFVAAILWWREATGASPWLAWTLLPAAFAGILWVVHDAPRGFRPVLDADITIAVGFTGAVAAFLRRDAIVKA